MMERNKRLSKKMIAMNGSRKKREKGKPIMPRVDMAYRPKKKQHNSCKKLIAYII